MNNLTTRKIVLGILMTLVLVFSVQGIADAITKFTKTSSTDNQIVAIEQPFTIRFSVSLQENQRIPNTSGTGYVDQDGDAIDRDGYRLHTNGHFLNAAGLPIDTQGYIRDGTGGAHRDPKEKAADTVRVKTTALKQFHFNEESISITSAVDSGSGTITFTKGSTEVTSLSEHAEESDQRLSSPVSLSCQANMAGVYTITIADTTPASTDTDDTPSDYEAASAITFTVTVLQAADTSRALTVRSGLSDIIVGEFGTQNLSVSVSNTTANARVEFEITKGPGSLSAVKTIGSKTSKRLSTLTGTDGVATVTLDPKKGTNHVRAWIYGNPPGTSGKSTEGIYIYRWASLKKVSGDSGDSGDPQQNQRGPVSSRLEEPFVVQLFDSTGRTTIPGAEITFTATATPTGALAYDPSTPANLREAITATTAIVKTDSNGKASIFLVLGAAQSGTYTVDAAYGTFDTKTFTATSFADTVTPRAQSIRKVDSTDGQSANQYGELEKPLTVVVRDQGGRRLAHTDTTSVIVTFVTLNGGDLISPTSSEPGTQSLETGALNTDRAKDIKTDVNGEASVRYTAPEEGGRRTVRASINNGLKSVVFTINGPAGSSDNQRDDDDDRDPSPPTITRTLDIDVSGTGSAREVTVTALENGASQTGISVDLTVSGAASLSRTSGGTPLESTLTLPSTAGTYTLRASTTATGYSAVTEDVTVTVPGTLTISTISPTTGAQQVAVTARRGGSLQSGVNFTISGSGIVPARGVTTATGSGNALLNFPRIGTYVLTVSADGYTSLPVSVTISTVGQTATTTTDTTTTTTDTTTTTTEDTPEPSRIQIGGQPTRTGAVVNTQLDAPLLVRVLDVDGNGVPDARVIFRVRTGQGRLSERGNGRAIGVQTDSSGFATANYTPASASSTVEAEVRGVTRSVKFTITTGAAPTTTTRTPGTGTTPGTISPTVLVGAANRAPMVWIDGGAIYSLVGASVQRFAPSVDNAQNLAVGGGKVYWTEATGNSGGTINAANLNGSGVTELASILAIPMGIAVDTAGSKLYWTNSRGKIQSANLNGSGITDVIPGGLEGAMDIALAGGNAYWTQGGNVRFVNLRGQKQVRNISTGTDTAGSLAIANGKVYWTEATGESGGTVNSANLNGSGATQLASILAAPVGIAVDTARSKLLWTNARGRIQSANLDGSGITNVVDGLGSPGDMVLSNSITAPTTATTTTTTTTADNAKYDVNGDGSVDNTDASLVAAAMNTSNTRYDVNGDGTVNFLDLLLVFDNRDPGAAGAPTIVGMKLTAVQIDVLQEQIDLLIATGDRSPAAMRTLVYLQQLIATARPEQTQLLANYPNPFNPETWIPYQLATDTNVRITIYNTHGVVIRTLELGHQSSGYYVGRDRAAYWDGRNAYGEQVASGIYFYQLETDEMSTMRKMVILK